MIILSFTNKLVLRPQGLATNHPQVILVVQIIIAIDTMIRGGHLWYVNSTHIMGTKMMNGIPVGRTTLSCVIRTSRSLLHLLPRRAISSIVPMVSHHDHTERWCDVLVIWTRLRLRSKSPRQRLQLIIDNCSHLIIVRCCGVRPCWKVGSLPYPHLLDEPYHGTSAFCRNRWYAY
jgi:succinyl-CoA:acetate CoA-transferase